MDATAARRNDAAPYDVERVRADFPILSRQVYGKPLVYLDNAASAQKPRQVIDAMSRFLEEDYSNVHRGVHYLSQRSTEMFEGARRRVAAFIKADEREIVFTHGGTEAFNLVAHSFGSFLNEGDEVVISALEHHANIVPWQLLRERKGIALKVAPIDERGDLILEEYERLLGSGRVKLVAITHMSNALGTITPAEEIVRIAHAQGAKVLLDGCQAITHLDVDVKALDCDFYVFSAHKLYGPTGIGVLYGKRELLNAMPPWQGGGDMIATVSFDKTTFKPAPFRFEAGTPPIMEAVGFAAALDYLDALGLENVAAHERDLLEYAVERVATIPGLKVHSQARRRASILSFTMEGAHPHDIGSIVDRAGVAIRAGHHCAQPLMERLGVPATARASFGLYNTRAEADALADALRQVQEIFG